MPHQESNINPKRRQTLEFQPEKSHASYSKMSLQWARVVVLLPLWAGGGGLGILPGAAALSQREV